MKRDTNGTTKSEIRHGHGCNGVQESCVITRTTSPMTYKPKMSGPFGDGANDADGLYDGLEDGLREVVGDLDPDVDGAIDVVGDTDGLEEGGGSVGPRDPTR